MKSYDFNAVVYDGSVYCTGCLPVGIDVDDAEVQPIFADEEWDSPAECESCGELHEYMNLGG